MTKHKIKIINRYNPPEVPTAVATCPNCEAGVIIKDLDNWKPDPDGVGLRVLENGIILGCAAEPGPAQAGWDQWYGSHFRQGNWYPVRQAVYVWFDPIYRLDPGRPTIEDVRNYWIKGADK